jgi:hypothetical protein
MEELKPNCRARSLADQVKPTPAGDVGDAR